jgi:glucose/arabinose dehydrogenase
MTVAIGAGVLTLASPVLLACSTDDPTVAPSPTSTVTSPAATSPAPTTSAASTPPSVSRGDDLATRLTVPWSIAALPAGSVLISERVSGRIDRVSLDGGALRTLGTVPGVVARGEGGLLGLAVSPDFLDDRFVYAYFTAADDNRVVRMRLQGDRLGDPEVVVDGIPAGSIHNGGRIAFGPDGKLWITTGDAGVRELAQDRESLAGKILRAEPDGSVPTDNPFGTLVWSLGHRNVQGLAWDSGDQPWATEFGSSEFDELNLIRKGGNYGWPQSEGADDDASFEQPAVTWPTDQASPSGLAIVDDIAYVGALRGQRVWQVPLRGEAAGEPVALLTGDLGRVRAVEPDPRGGGLLVSTSNQDGRGNPQAGDDRVVVLTFD